MSTTYIKDGHVHGRFNPTRFGRYDQLGRDLAITFWNQKGWVAETHDRDQNNKLLWQNTDLRVTQNDRFINIEAAVKRDNLWKFVHSGVDVETRKLKYVKQGERAFVSMGDYLEIDSMVSGGSNMLLIPMDCLVAAQKDCGKEYLGQGSVLSSASFDMPEHGCHRVRKRCKRGFGQTGEAEDFYRIPYEYVAHYKRDSSGTYQPISVPERKLTNG